MYKLYLLAVTVVILLGSFISFHSNDKYSPSPLPLEERVDSLLALMNLEEKIGQLVLFTSDIDVTGPTIREGYGASLAGCDYNTVGISERELRQTYLPPYKAALDAGAATIMTSFNELDGIPVTGSKYLMKDILRQEWGFDGFVVTDYTSINEMIPHGYARDLKQAVELAIKAGVDMDMQGAAYYDHLKDLVQEGTVGMNTIDQAVKNILRLKFRLGLLDDPYRYSDVQREKERVLSASHLERARDVARNSIVLLKNENQTLPIPSEVNGIAVIGPLADSQRDMIGSWSAAGEFEIFVGTNSS